METIHHKILTIVDIQHLLHSIANLVHIQSIKCLQHKSRASRVLPTDISTIFPFEVVYVGESQTSLKNFLTLALRFPVKSFLKYAQPSLQLSIIDELNSDISFQRSYFSDCVGAQGFWHSHWNTLQCSPQLEFPHKSFMNWNQTDCSLSVSTFILIVLLLDSGGNVDLHI